MFQLPMLYVRLSLCQYYRHIFLYVIKASWNTCHILIIGNEKTFELLADFDLQDSGALVTDPTRALNFLIRL